jgi:hypothetical protein
MRKLFSIVALLTFAAITVEAQTGADVEPFKLSWQAVVAIVAGCYEVIARVIPTVGNWSLTGKIIEALHWLSDFLNRTKK